MPEPSVTAPTAADRPPWHAALAFAVLGQVPDGVSEPGGVQLAVLVADLDAHWPGGTAAIRDQLLAAGASRLPAHPIPEALRSALPAAQMTAALSALQHQLGLGGSRGRVATPRSLDADERRLRADVPPHHGS